MQYFSINFEIFSKYDKFENFREAEHEVQPKAKN